MEVTGKKVPGVPPPSVPKDVPPGPKVVPPAPKDAGTKPPSPSVASSTVSVDASNPALLPLADLDEGEMASVTEMEGSMVEMEMEDEEEEMEEPPPPPPPPPKPKKKRNFKRKPDKLPNEYANLNKIQEKETEKHNQRWLRAQEMRRGIVRPKRMNEMLKLMKYTSHAYFNNLWAEAHVELRAILKEERERGEIRAEKKEMWGLLTESFVKYLALYKKLDEVHDQMVHPQKRILVRKLLDLVIVRVQELRKELVNTELSEVYYYDDLIFMQKMIPDDLDVPIPKYYYHDPPENLKQRDLWFESLKLKHQREEEERLEQEKRTEAMKAAKKEAEDDEFGFGDGMMGGDGYGGDVGKHLSLIQRMERARQARFKYRVARYMQEEEAKAVNKAQLKKLKKKGKQMSEEKAVAIIQKIVRGYLARCRVKRMRDEELELLGIRIPAANGETATSKAVVKCQQNVVGLGKLKDRRRDDRRRNQQIYEEAQVSIEERLRQLEGPEMMERFKFQIRTWMLDVKETLGKLPKKLLKPEQGGTRFFICPEKLPPELLEKGKMATDKEYAKKKKKEAKKDKKKQKKKDKQEKKNAARGKLELGVKFEAPKHLKDMVKSNIEYNKIWRARDEKDNPDQKHEEGFIIHEKRQLVGEEVRKKVDVAMVAELKILKMYLEGKGKRRGKKKGKGGEDDMASEASTMGMAGRRKHKMKYKYAQLKAKKSKKVKGKDLTANIPAEDLFHDLVDKGIIVEYPKVRLDSLAGTWSLINGEIRSFWEADPTYDKSNEERPFPGDLNPQPTFGDLKKAVKDIAIIPVGGKDVHKMSPYTKSLLLAGPEGSGKKTLINAIATEMHATMFDISPAKIAGHFPKKKGLKMLFHLIQKMTRMCAPSIVKFERVERTYAKGRVPKDEKWTQPKRLKKKFYKLRKMLGPGDQVLFIGTTAAPWMAKPKFLRRDWEKVIYIPKPDYHTRAEIWRQILNPNLEYLDKDVHLSLLTKLSDGWTAGNIVDVCKTVVGGHVEKVEKEKKEKELANDDPFAFLEAGSNKKQFGKNLIHMDQFLEEFAKYDPVFVEMEKAWNKFFNSTALQAARLNAQRGPPNPEDGKKKGKRMMTDIEKEYIKAGNKGKKAKPKGKKK